MTAAGRRDLRTPCAWLLVAAGVGLLVWDLDDVPMLALAAAIAALVAGATLLSRPAR